LTVEKCQTGEGREQRKVLKEGKKERGKLPRRESHKGLKGGNIKEEGSATKRKRGRREAES